jgi:hypothetical protein
MFSHKKTAEKPPKYPQRLRRTIANYKKEEETEQSKLVKQINSLSAEMGLLPVKAYLNEEPEIPENVLNQLAEHNIEEVKGTKGGSRRSRKQRRKTRKVKSKK